MKYDMSSIASFFNHIKNKNKVTFVDDITWNDIDMDLIYRKVNNTKSTVGREVLYSMLREENTDLDVLRKRDNVIEFFLKNQENRFEVEYKLSLLGFNTQFDTTNCMFIKNLGDINKKIYTYRVLSVIPIIMLILSVFNLKILVIFVLSLFLNIIVSIKGRKHLSNVDNYGYIIKVVNTLISIKKLELDVLKNHFSNIEYELKKVSTIKRKKIGSSRNAIISEINMFEEYLNLIFLREISIYEDVKKKFGELSESLIKVYYSLGEIDSLISVASFRASLDYYSKPNFDLNGIKEKNELEFEKLFHPIIDNPISSSGKFKGGNLITSSNASGKSTFIKSIAINAILAQSIFTVCAESYKTPFFEIYTSMAVKDNIESNDSYFMAEIKSLKRVVDSLTKDTPVLCFVDEILKGTNTVERIAASSEILAYIQRGNCLCFAATHDIELTYMLDGIYENYHFEEQITDIDIAFDYKLRNGRTESRNAIKLLRVLGYDKDIVRGADDRVSKFMGTGKW